MCSCKEIPKNFNCPTVQKLYNWMLDKRVMWYFVRSNDNYNKCFPYEKRKDIISHRVVEEVNQDLYNEIYPEWQGFIYLWFSNDVFPLDVFKKDTTMVDLRFDDTVTDIDDTKYLQFRFGVDKQIDEFLKLADLYYNYYVR